MDLMEKHFSHHLHSKTTQNDQRVLSIYYFNYFTLICKTDGDLTRWHAIIYVFI